MLKVFCLISLIYLLYHSFTDILLQNTLVNFLYTSDFITINPIDLSCKVTSTTSNEVIPPQTTEVTDTQNWNIMPTSNNWINWIKFGCINKILKISWIILKMDIMHTVTLQVFNMLLNFLQLINIIRYITKKDFQLYYLEILFSV